MSVGAQFTYMDCVIKVWKTEVVEDVPRNIEPGKVLSVDGDGDGVVIKAGVGAIRLCETSPSISLHEGTYL